MVMPTTLNTVRIQGINYASDALRVETWRTVNGVGNWQALLRNINGQYNSTFDVQNSFALSVDGTFYFFGFVDGPAVQLRGKDGEDIWDEYVLVKGVDMAQDLLFHNDFEKEYPNNSTQRLQDVLHDVFNIQLLGSTPITYPSPAPGTTPLVGAVEFRVGASFLSTLQELFNRVGYLFYVDDTYVLRVGSALAGVSAAPWTGYSSAGGILNNIIDTIDLQKRDGDKLYNYVKLYGKSPMFDGYTEENASSWNESLGAGLQDEQTTVRVGEYSIVSYNNNPVVGGLRPSLSCPVFNYTTWDFSDGEIGVWARYDNDAGAPGTQGAGSSNAQEPVSCTLVDNLGRFAIYYSSTQTNLYRGEWGYCTFPLGEQFHTAGAAVDETWVLTGADLDWEHIISLMFEVGGVGNAPSHFYIDGIRLPVPVLGISENVASQATYRRRPYLDSWSHVRTQNAIQQASASFLAQHKDTLLNNVKFVTSGTTALRYAGQSINLDIPPLGITGPAVYYMSSIHHVIEPHVDVSGGFGFDWVAEVEAVPTSTVGYDMGRLRVGPAYSAMQVASRVGGGVKNK